MHAWAYPIPEPALDDRLAFIGTSGSGKTYNAGSAIEKLLGSAAKVVIVDPLGVWWGLRLKANGSSSAFDLPIFGGAHGDLPLNESAGKLIGEAVASMRESCIVDLSALQTKEAERRFMLAFLEALYRHAGGDPMHAVFDEADLWAPQNPSKTGAGPQLQSLMEQIVRRGRVRGFIPWLITQRPAVISKDVLSQADGLIAFKLTSSQDRAALGAWIEGQADREAGKEILGALPAMERGRGVVWIPARGILKTVDFPPKLTFDSSATPKRGEKRKARDLKPLDLEGLKGKLASVEAEAKANDPKALKAEIARLGRELAEAQKGQPPAEIDPQALHREYMRGKVDGYGEGVRDGGAPLAGVLKAFEPLERAIAAVKSEAPKVEAWAQRQPKGPSPAPKPSPPRQMTTPAAPNGANGEIPSGCQKPLAALAGIYPAGMSEPQWALAAGYKRSGGTWGTYKSRLRQAGLIEARDGQWFATELGAQAVGPVETPPAPGPELVRWWAAKLPGTAKIAEALIGAFPEALGKEELASRVGMIASGGSFGTYLSRLASPGLISRDGGIRLTDEVMGA